MRKKIFSLFLFLFGFKKSKVVGKKGSIIVLIDGLSYDAFQYAMKMGYCPTLKKATLSSPPKKYYCGLPAATTATEALLFYGNKTNIPGFTWYDRTLKQFVRGNRSWELTSFEDIYSKKRSLFVDGSVIMGVYSGGATELSMSGRNLTFKRSFYFLKTAHYFLMAILYPIQLIRTIYLAIKTILLYRKSTHHSSHETFSKMILGQFSCFLTEIEIMRGTKKIFVDFLLYDEYAHEYGPTHTATLSTLRLVDRYIKRIIRTAKNSGNAYNLIFMSDHGQTESIPYDFPETRSTSDIQEALHNNGVSVIKTYGGFIPPHTSGRLYCVPAGSTLQLYFSHSLDTALTLRAIEEQFPGFISRLLEKEAFGWILVRQSDTSAILIGKKGSVEFNKNEPFKIQGIPFSNMQTKEVQKLLESFHTYSQFTNNGDLVLFGNVTRENKVYSFEKHKGTHGGFFGPMTHPFIMTKDISITGDSMEQLFDTIAVSL